MNPICTQFFAIVQLIAWSRMDQKQQMKLPQEAAAPDASAPASSRPSSASGSKSSKAASLSPLYPHMYAVELSKPAWLLAMINSAEKSFHHDASKDPMLKRNQRLSEADISRKVAVAAARNKLAWINIQIGAANPPTALFRFVLFLSKSTSLGHVSYSTDCFLAVSATHVCSFCSSIQHHLPCLLCC